MKCDMTAEKPAECSKMLLSAKTKENKTFYRFIMKKKKEREDTLDMGQLPITV